MKKISLMILALVAAIVFIGHASAQSDKFDGECSGQEVIGRCADKQAPKIVPAPAPVINEAPAPFYPPPVEGK